MQHKFPLCVLHMKLKDISKVDVNVHPNKMEVRFLDGPGIFGAVSAGIRERLRNREMIPAVGLDGKQPSDREMQLLQEMSRQGKPAQGVGRGPYGFTSQGSGSGNHGTTSRSTGSEHCSTTSQSSGSEKCDTILQGIDEIRQDAIAQNSAGIQQNAVPQNSTAGQQQPLPQDMAPEQQENSLCKAEGGMQELPLSDKKEKPQAAPEPFEVNRTRQYRVMEEMRYEADRRQMQDYHQGELFEDKVLTPEKRVYFKLIGQVFDTYWLIEYEDKLFIIDQHAAHEKVKFERFMKQYHEKSLVTQNLMPPIIVSLTGQEETAYKEYASVFAELGFEVEPFGGSEYALRSVPVDLYGCQEKELFLSVLDDLLEGGIRGDLTAVREKIASMSCKAAVKGNNRLSIQEAQQLIDELLTLDNPYNCPHGRPTIISMSKYEMEKKFKR